MKYLLVIFAILFLGLPTVIAQTDPTPGNIKLLPGYHHQSGQGFDSRAGKIWKEGGAQVRYDIGDMAGNYADCKLCGWTKGEVWRKTYSANGQNAIYVFTKGNNLVVSFPDSKANFVAVINNESDLTDVLLMLATFHSLGK
jgi:hypothetical protein